MPITPADERAHTPDASDAAWEESWSLVFADSSGLAGRVSTTLYPGDGECAVFALVLRPGAEPVVARDVFALPSDFAEVRGDGIWLSQWCEDPFDFWTYGLEAFGVALEHAHDAWDGELGVRVPVGWDLDFEAAGAPFDTGSGYTQPGVVHGDVQVADGTFALDGFGLRAHHWGMPREQARLWWHDDQGHVAVSDDRAVRWRASEPQLLDVRGYASEVDMRGFPTRVDVTLGAGESSFGIEPYAWAGEIIAEDPLVVVPHAAVRVQRDGLVIGMGWQEGGVAS